MKTVVAMLMISLVSIAASARDEDSISTRLQTSNSPTRSELTLVPMLGGGVGWMNFDGGDASNGMVMVPNISFVAGALLEYGADRYAFQTGVIYLREAGSMTLDRVGHIGSSTVSYAAKANVAVDQIGIPLIAKLNSDRRYRRFGFRAGLIPTYEIARTVDVTSDVSADDVKITDVQKSSNREALRAINVVALIGAGIELPLSHGRDLRIELTYDRSLLPLNEDGQGAKMFSSSLLASLAMGFGV